MILLGGLLFCRWLGFVLFAFPVGMLFDAFGYHFVFYLFSAIVSVILLFGVVFLSNGRNTGPRSGVVQNETL